MIISYELSSAFSKNNKQSDQIELSCDTITVEEFARQLNLDMDEIGIIVVNGVLTKADTILKNDDVVKLFPPIISG